jgi:phosphate transport system protein
MLHLQDELNNLKDSLTEMSYQVMNQIEKSVNSITNFDKDLAQEVIRNEKRINALELKIDRECEIIFSLMAPVAKDMRFVFATLKINNDLERIADYAENNSLMVMELNQPFEEKLLEDLRLMEMHQKALSMMTDVITAYSSENSEVARGVFTDDFILNEIHRAAKPIIAAQCKKDPDNIGSYMDLWSVIRRLERIGDHLTNISEEIIFYLEAKVLKHEGKQTAKKKIKKNKS